MWFRVMNPVVVTFIPAGCFSYSLDWHNFHRLNLCCVSAAELGSLGDYAAVVFRNVIDIGRI
jgi:hypothetical protein